MQLALHIVVHLERQCHKCQQRLSVQVLDYGVIKNEQEFDEKIGHNDIRVGKIICSKCDGSDWAEDIALYNITGGNHELVDRVKVGSKGFPVAGAADDAPYAIKHSPQEHAEYKRGLDKTNDHYQEHQQEFWDNFCNHAVSNWPKLIKELTAKEFALAYTALRLPLLSPTASASVWRKDIEKRIITDKEKTAFWQLANTPLVENEFIWVPVDNWPMAEWIKEYGRERVAYITLHLPMPEELERWRTEALAQVVKKRSGETGILLERIWQLGHELDKQRRRSVELSSLLAEERQKNALLADQVGQLKQQLARQEKPQVINRDPDDIRKIRELKGLIGEMRAEIDRLTGLVPQEKVLPPVEEDTPVISPTEEPVDISVLDGKTIAVVGWPDEVIEEGYRVVWHDGDGVDHRLEALAKEADVLVVLTRFISHQTMWWLKETAIDMGKPIHYVRERNVGRILEIVARHEQTKTLAEPN